jgi:hypothetical protein
VKLSKRKSRLSTEILGELHMAIGICLLKPTDVSLRVFSLVQLYTAIYLRRDLFDTGMGGMGREGRSSEVVRSVIRQWFQRPTMHLSGDSVKVHYDAAISRAIAPQLSGSAPTIGQWLLDAVLESSQTALLENPNPDAVSLQVELRITDQGCLRWTWAMPELTIWLHHAARSIHYLPLLAAPGDPRSAQLWPALYAHSRCADYLAQHLAPPVALATTPTPWEMTILLKLMEIIDRLVEMPLPPRTDFYMQALKTVVQAFEAIDRHCFSPIGEPLSPFRLGLVMLIKSLLYQLLHHGLGLKVVDKM